MFITVSLDHAGTVKIHAYNDLEMYALLSYQQVVKLLPDTAVELVDIGTMTGVSFYGIRLFEEDDLQYIVRTTNVDRQQRSRARRAMFTYDRCEGRLLHNIEARKVDGWFRCIVPVPNKNAIEFMATKGWVPYPFEPYTTMTDSMCFVANGTAGETIEEDVIFKSAMMHDHAPMTYEEGAIPVSKLTLDRMESAVVRDESDDKEEEDDSYLRQLK